MKSSRRLVGVSLLALMGVLVCLGGGWLAYANRVPVITPAAVRLPTPNAYDDYTAAIGLLAGGSPRSWDLAKMPAETRRSLLAQNREALERLRQGFQYEFRNPPHNPSVPGSGNVSGFDGLGRLLVLEGMQAEGEGRIRDAAESYLDCLQLGVDLPKGGTLIHGLVGAEIQERGLGALQGLAPRLEERSALHVLQEMHNLDRTGPTMAEIIAGERDGGMVELSQMLRNTGPMQAAATAGYNQNVGMAVEYFLTPKSQMLSNYQQYMTACSERAAKPLYDPAPQPVMPKDFLVRHLAPAMDLARKRWALREAEWRVTEASLAVRAYEADHGQPPARLEQLVPKYLSAVPADPFAPQPLLFRRTDGRTVVYSRGPDGDDDQGFQGSPKNAFQDGDLVRVQPRR